jgi:2-hydroxychromene-2-carboxylate isomerase
MQAGEQGQKTLEFWFDYTCPYAYLGSVQVRQMARRMGAALRMCPMLLGGVFKANGTPQKLFQTIPAPKAAHNASDLARWAALFQVPPVSFPSEHPMRSVEALRATIASGCDPKVIAGFFEAYWQRREHISSEPVMRRVLEAAGHDASSLIEAAQSEAIKDELRARTDRAIGLGIFGAPAYVTSDGHMYWGQDRMHFVAQERAEQTMAAISSPPKGSSVAKHSVELFWDFSSPFAYLGVTQAQAMAERTGAQVIFRPMLLGGVFKAIGQAEVPLFTWSDAKRRYYLDDLHRWAAYWGVPFNFPQTFPMSSIKALRAYLALPEALRADYMHKTFEAYWVHGKDISTDAVLGEIIGSDASAVLGKTQDPDIKKQLIDATSSAVERGVFGAFIYIVDGKDLYWGQDRLPLVERALSA